LFFVFLALRGRKTKNRRVEKYQAVSRQLDIGDILLALQATCSAQALVFLP